MATKKTPPVEAESASALWTNAPWFVSLATFGLLVLVEYFFYLPSSLLHSDGVESLWRGASSGVVCTAEYAPVCGKDGEIYANSCSAKAANVEVARFGECTLGQTPPTGAGVEITVPLTTDTPPEKTDVITTDAMSMDLANLDLTKYQLYTNQNFRYTLALPKYAYYKGMSSSDRRSHVILLGLSATEVEALESAPLRIIYSPAGVTADSSSTESLRLPDGATVSFMYQSPLPEKSQKILNTVRASIATF